MSAIYENNRNEVCIQLCDNDYILVMNKNKKSILKITSKCKNLVVETIKNEKEKERRFKNGSNKMS